MMVLQELVAIAIAVLAFLYIIGRLSGFQLLRAKPKQKVLVGAKLLRGIDRVRKR